MFHLLIFLTTVYFPKISVNIRVSSCWMLYSYERKCLSWRLTSFSKSRTVWGKQRIIVSILWSWGVKVKETSLRLKIHHWRNLIWIVCVQNVSHQTSFPLLHIRVWLGFTPPSAKLSVTPLLFSYAAELNLSCCQGWFLCCGVKLYTSVFHLLV